MEGKKEMEVSITYFKTKKGKLKVSRVSDNISLAMFYAYRETFRNKMQEENFNALNKYFEKKYKKTTREEKREALVAYATSFKEIFEGFKEIFDKSLKPEGVEYHYKEKEQ